MRALVVNTFLTLDGVMQAPGGPEEDPTGGFTHGGWSVPHWDDHLMGERMDESLDKPFDLLLGRGTYEIFAAHWPHLEGDPTAETFNKARKYVATTTLGSADWVNTTVLNGDVPAQVAELKAQGGPEIQVHGSWGLIQTLLRHDLVDELRLMVFPVVVGAGKRLFDHGTVPATFTARHVQTTDTGVVLVNYTKTGAGVGVGSFALEEPTEAEVRRRADLAES